MRGSHREKTLVYERENFTESRDFHATPEDHGMNVPGPGTLDTFLVVAETDNFGVRVETDETPLVNDSYDKLATHSADLSHVSAYQNANGEYVIAVSDFAYLKHVRAEVTCIGTVDFDWVRAVYTIDA